MQGFEHFVTIELANFAPSGLSKILAQNGNVITEKAFEIIIGKLSI
jgi:hypothetical protein